MVAQRQRDVLRDGKVIEQLAPVEHKAEAQPCLQAGVLEDGHRLSEETVLPPLRRHHAAGQHEEIALARALQPPDDPVIAGADRPVDVLGDQDRRVMQGTDRHVGHLDCRRCGLGWEWLRHVTR